MPDDRQITDVDETQLAVMSKYGEVTLGLSGRTVSVCSLHNGETTSCWSYVGYGTVYEGVNGPDPVSAIGETYMALEHAMWYEVNR